MLSLLKALGLVAIAVPLILFGVDQHFVGADQSGWYIVAGALVFVRAVFVAASE